jgi:hypothetical protein
MNEEDRFDKFKSLHEQLEVLNDAVEDLEDLVEKSEIIFKEIILSPVIVYDEEGHQHISYDIDTKTDYKANIIKNLDMQEILNEAEDIKEGYQDEDGE